MKLSLRKGFSFGVTSAIITTLGLMMGLNASTNSAAIVIGGVLIIAIADALSDAFGIHISEESEDHHTPKEIWESTLSTFVTKFVIASTFIVPILFLPLHTAVYVSALWGLLLITLLSYNMARGKKKNTYAVIGEHLVITIFVIFLTHNIGHWISTVFG
jgi:VIT1/CCC1 family predicted Fe2+/Mn2+ transporter